MCSKCTIQRLRICKLGQLVTRRRGVHILFISIRHMHIHCSNAIYHTYTGLLAKSPTLVWLNYSFNRAYPIYDASHAICSVTNYEHYNSCVEARTTWSTLCYVCVCACMGYDASGGLVVANNAAQRYVRLRPNKTKTTQLCAGRRPSHEFLSTNVFRIRKHCSLRLRLGALTSVRSAGTHTRYDASQTPHKVELCTSQQNRPCVCLVVFECVSSSVHAYVMCIIEWLESTTQLNVTTIDS